MAAHTHSSSRSSCLDSLRSPRVVLSPCVPPISLHTLPMSGSELHAEILGEGCETELWALALTVPRARFVLAPLPRASVPGARREVTALCPCRTRGTPWAAFYAASSPSARRSRAGASRPPPRVSTSSSSQTTARRASCGRSCATPSA